jgi:7,8-dihydro-6-hydroxymethylpterin-pyrophosphokinase
MGRAQPGEGYVRHGPRPIDVDLLLLGDTTYSSERLTLPHEQVLARRFVLIPLLELDFDLATPDGTLLRDALAALPVEEGVRREGPPLNVPGAG